jgi:23S rRNA (pseudouridine1915-N3)-methyltransferase
MRLTIACVGKPRGFAAEAAEEYLARIRRYAGAELVTVRPERDADRDPPVTQHREGERLLHAVPRGATLIALDTRGRTLTSEAFSRELRGLAEGGIRELAFVVGGPVGLSEEVRRRARFLLSLSAMTLPHELALVVLCEQIYRAFTISRGEPYHK